MRGDDELDRGVPVRVEYEHGVVVKSLEYLGAEPAKAWHQADLVALVQLEALLARQHDGGHVCQQPRADNLTHVGHSSRLSASSASPSACRRLRLAISAARTLCSSRRSRSRTSTS